MDDNIGPLDGGNAEAKDRTAPIKELSSHRKWIKVDPA
jgi:hypothetical protein